MRYKWCRVWMLRELTLYDELISEKKDRFTREHLGSFSRIHLGCSAIVNFWMHAKSYFRVVPKDDKQHRDYTIGSN